MAINYFPDDISLFPFAKELKGYTAKAFRQDAMAALSVALLTVPQAMAYAMLAGLPISCGLFAAIYSAIIAAAFGSSRHLVVGPSNAIAILIQAGISEVLFTYYRDFSGPERDFIAVQILTQLVVLTAFLQILAAIFKLGRLTQFVSHSVIVGYMLGTAIAVVINQLFPFFGLTRERGVDSLYGKIVYLITHFSQSHVPTALIGLSSLLLLLSLKRINKKIPAAVIALAFAALTAYLYETFLSTFFERWVDPYGDEHLSKILLVGDRGNVSDVIPHFNWPFFNTAVMNDLLPAAFALALLSIMETTSVTKSIAASSGQRLSINQEIFGLSLGNLVSSFVGALPVSGSPSRSGLIYKYGAQTRFAAIFNALFVGIILFTLGFLVTQIPLASLSALLIFSSTNIVNIKQFLICLKATSSDAFVLGVTLLSCFFFNLNIALYIGVVLSIILYLKKSALPQIVEYEISEAGELKNIVECQQKKRIRLIKVEGELFFGAADLFQSTLKAFAEDDTYTKVIILQLKNARDIDATACLALQQLHDYLKGSQRYLIACGITQQVWDVLSDSAIIEQIGKENLFIFDERHPHQYLFKAFQRAKELIQSSDESSQVLIEASTKIVDETFVKV